MERAVRGGVEPALARSRGIGEGESDRVATTNIPIIPLLPRLFDGQDRLGRA